MLDHVEMFTKSKWNIGFTFMPCYIAWWNFKISKKLDTYSNLKVLNVEISGYVVINFGQASPYLPDVNTTFLKKNFWKWEPFVFLSLLVKIYTVSKNISVSILTPPTNAYHMIIHVHQECAWWCKQKAYYVLLDYLQYFAIYLNTKCSGKQ